LTKGEGEKEKSCVGFVLTVLVSPFDLSSLLMFYIREKKEYKAPELPMVKSLLLYYLRQENIFLLFCSYNDLVFTNRLGVANLNEVLFYFKYS